jgi:hypothetical protein
MSNPTGTTYLTANSGYAWTDGDVYEIAQTDQQEGAAIGGSFSGLGVDNQPHQALLNKVQLVHGRQLTDESNIGLLQAFQAMFTGSISGSFGFLKIPVTDLARGAITYLIQWGIYEPPSGVVGDMSYVITWNTPFPNLCSWAGATMAYNSTKDLGVGVWQPPNAAPALTTVNGTFYVNVFNVNGAQPGFFWLAVGY